MWMGRGKCRYRVAAGSGVEITKCGSLENANHLKCYILFVPAGPRAEGEQVSGLYKYEASKVWNTTHGLEERR